LIIFYFYENQPPVSIEIFWIIDFLPIQKTEPQFPSSGNSVIIGKIHDYHPKFCDRVIQLLITDILRDDTDEYLARVDSMGILQFRFDLENPR
jgi:hypothetical protein